MAAKTRMIAMTNTQVRLDNLGNDVIFMTSLGISGGSLMLRA
jgi:hypothetical protein